MALFPSVRVVCVRPLLPVVSLVGLSVTFPSFGLTLNATVSPCLAVPSSRTSTTNVKAAPGAPDPGPLITTMENCGGGGGGGGEVVTVAVPVVDTPLLVALIVYEPEALFPSVRVICACPLLPVVAGFGVPSVAFPSPVVILNVTDWFGEAVPFSRTSTTKVNVSPGAPDPGLLITTMENVDRGGGGEVWNVAVPLTELPLLSSALIVYEPATLLVTVVCARPLLPVVGFGVPSVTLFALPEVTLNVTD